MSRKYKALDLINRVQAKMETLEGRRVNFADTAQIHHEGLAAALAIIEQQEQRIASLEKLVLAIDAKVNP
jgi:hypothetical protein